MLSPSHQSQLFPKSRPNHLTLVSERMRGARVCAHLYKGPEVPKKKQTANTKQTTSSTVRLQPMTSRGLVLPLSCKHAKPL